MPPRLSRTLRPRPAIVGAALITCAALAACGKDTVRPPQPALVAAVAGTTPQTATVGTAVAARPSVKVTDAGGDPVSGVEVRFAVASGGGTILGGSSLDTTDATGTAAVGGWTLGTRSGENTLTATVGGLTPVTFTATGTAGAAAKLARNSASPQSGVVNAAVAAPPSVLVQDQYDNPVAGALVSFTPSQGSVVGPGTVATNAAGIATVGGWVLGTIAGTNSLRAAVSGVGNVDFNATGATLPATSFASVVPVGVGPSAVAFSPDGATAYVANAASNSVSFVDVVAGTVTGTASIGQSPYSIATSADGARVYVGTATGGLVIVLDAATRATVASIATAGIVTDLAVHRTQPLLYAATTGGPIFEISTATNSVVRSFTVDGAPSGLALSATGDHLWVASQSGGLRVRSLDVPVTATVAGAVNASDVALTPDNTLAFATSYADGKLYVIDRASGSLIATRPLDGLPLRIAISPSGSTLAVTNDGGWVTFIQR